jgi:hypothetical protein
VKLWDLRHPRSPAVSLSSHGSAVRSLTFGQAEIAPVHVVFGLESGMILRYDLRVRNDNDRMCKYQLTQAVIDANRIPRSNFCTYGMCT